MKNKLRHYVEILTLEHRRNEYRIGAETFIVNKDLNKYRSGYNYLAFVISFFFSILGAIWGEKALHFNPTTIGSMLILIFVGAMMYLIIQSLIFIIFLKTDAHKLQKKIKKDIA